VELLKFTPRQYISLLTLILSFRTKPFYKLLIMHSHTMYGQSPHSSSGVAGSSEGTPDTRFTAFSPEDVRPTKAGGIQAGASLSDMQQDPFVNTKSKLSAEVEDFKPKMPSAQTGFKPYDTVPNTEVFGFANSATAALPAVIEQLREVTAQANAKFGSPQGNVGPTGPTNAALQGIANQSGIFSTDTNETRCMMVTSFSKTDTAIRKAFTNVIEVNTAFLMQKSWLMSHLELEEERLQVCWCLAH
jgi:hypothetical protein